MRYCFILVCLYCTATAFAQNFARNQILFWADAGNGDRMEVIRDDTAQARRVHPLAVRRYYGKGPVIREEFLRIDPQNWLFNSYDTAGAWRSRRGRMSIDPLRIYLDSIFDFDPETYEEIVSFDTLRLLLPQGYWEETDTAGWLWKGNYLDGKRTGTWSKSKWLDEDICDCRNVVYDTGLVLHEQQRNLALSKDTAAMVRQLTGSEWQLYEHRTLYPRVMLLSVKRERDFNLTWPRLPYVKNGYSHVYYTHKNGQATFLYAGEGQWVKEGHWYLTDDLTLHFRWGPDWKSSYKIISFMDDRIIALKQK